MSEPHICLFSGSSSDRASVCPCVRLSVCPFVCLTGWNIMGMHGEKNTWLSCTVFFFFFVHAQHNATRTTNMDRRGPREPRSREGSEQRACRRLERDRKSARQQDREDNGRDLEPEAREGSKSTSKESSRRKQTACM